MFTLGDLTVNRIGFGAKRLGNDKRKAIELLRQVIGLGVNHIDTAGFYPTVDEENRYWANEIIREALHPYPQDLVIATKVGPVKDGIARPGQLRGLVEQDLRDLGADRLDVVYLRLYGVDDITEHFAALAELRAEGLIRHLALSNARLTHLAQAQAIAPVVAVQNVFGVDIGRQNDEMLRVCGEQGIAFVPFFALAGTGREKGGVIGNDAVNALAERYDITPAQVRLAWTLSRGPHVLAIPGSGNIEHVKQNLKAAELTGIAELADRGFSAVETGS